MSNYPTLKNEAELIKISTNDYEIKKIKSDLEEFNRQKNFDKNFDQFTNILNELKKEKIKYEKKSGRIDKGLIFTKIVSIISGVTTLGGVTLTATVLASIAGVPLSVASFILSLSSLITSFYLEKYKLKCVKIKNYINITILLYEKTMKNALKDNKIDENEGKDLKDIYQYYLNHKADIKKSFQFKVEDVFKDFGSMLEKEGLTKDIIDKLNDFLNKNSNQK